MQLLENEINAYSTHWKLSKTKRKKPNYRTIEIRLDVYVRVSEKIWRDIHQNTLLRISHLPTTQTAADTR